MFGSAKNMFKVTDLRNKIVFTLFVILLYRLGSNITVPGIDFNAVQDLQRQAQQGGVLGFLNLFSGGALTQMAVFALGIMPYITSSIIMQLLAVVIPRIEQWQKQGAVGQKKITQWTRYMTVGLAILQATGITYQFNNGLLGRGTNTNLKLVTQFDVPHVALIVLTITAGTAIVMWMGELITQRGIGNGMSILIFANVVSRMPAQFGNVQAEKGNVAFTLFMLVGIAMIVAIVFVEQGQRRIPVQFAKRVLGRRMTLSGPLFPAAIALVPYSLLSLYGVRQFPFGGTTILIAVGVALETMKQIDSQLMMRNYEGFLASCSP